MGNSACRLLEWPFSLSQERCPWEQVVSLWEGRSAPGGSCSQVRGPAPRGPAAELTSRQGPRPLAPYPVQCPRHRHLSARKVGQGRVVICRDLPPPAYVFTLHRHLSEKMQIENGRDLWRSKIRKEILGREDISFIWNLATVPVCVSALLFPMKRGDSGLSDFSW